MTFEVPFFTSTSCSNRASERSILVKSCHWQTDIMETGGMLSLKDNVVVKNDTLQDLPQVDHAIRPRCSNSPEIIRHTADSQDNGVDAHDCQTADDTGTQWNSDNGSPVDEIADDFENVKDDVYYLVPCYLRYDYKLLPYNFIVFTGIGGVVYERFPEHNLSGDLDSDDGKDKAQTAGNLMHFNKLSDSSEEDGVKFCDAEKPDNSEGKERLSDHIEDSERREQLLSKLPMEGLNGFLKVSGKRQRRKKLNSLLGSFDFYFSHYLQPAPVSIVLFPARRQTSKKAQGLKKRQDGSTSSQPQQGDRSWLPVSVNGMPQVTFRQELQRLGTFHNMPPNLRVFAVRLAHVGFLCLPDGVVVCYFCGLRWEGGNNQDSPLVAHRRQRPSCPMLTGESCDNIPVSVFDMERVQELMEIWSLTGPSVLSAEPGSQVTAAEVTGFVPSAPQVTTSRRTIESTQGNGRPTASMQQQAEIAEDSARVPTTSEQQASGSDSSQAPAAVTTATLPNLDVHSSNSQAGSTQQSGSAEGSAASAAAPLAAGNSEAVAVLDGTAQPEVPGTVARLPTQQTQSKRGQQVVTYQQLGIVTEAPKHADMALINSRVATFRNWPSTRSHTPLTLSEAGFYYAGYADCGRCFFCGGGLKNWDPVDNAWVEHARWFPKCAYVRQCQGQDFVDIIQEMNSASERRQISMEQVREEIRKRRADGDRIQEPLVDPAITSALEVGFTQEEVDAAVERMQREGHALTAAKLVDCLQANGLEAAGEVDDSAEDPDDLAQARELTTANNEIRQQRMCKICLDKEVCIVFLPCGHLVCCAECSPAIRNCPMCRQRVKGKVRAFPA